MLLWDLTLSLPMATIVDLPASRCWLLSRQDILTDIGDFTRPISYLLTYLLYF